MFIVKKILTALRSISKDFDNVLTVDYITHHAAIHRSLFDHKKTRFHFFACNRTGMVAVPNRYGSGSTSSIAIEPVRLG